MERITNENGEKTYPSDGKRGGKGYAQSCLLCQQYWEKPQILIGGALHVTCLCATY
jgi:hypothetical protein